jgi:hypothetical protein
LRLHDSRWLVHTMCPPRPQSHDLSVGGKASMRARLRQKRTPLRTNEQRMVALERAVASLDDGESSIKRCAAMISAVQVAHRIWSDTELEEHIKALEAAK